MKKVHVKKFLLLGWPAKPFSTFFSVCGPKIKIQLSAIFCLVILIPKRYYTHFKSLEGNGRIWQKCPFWGSRQKITCNVFGLSCKFGDNPLPSLKALFWGDTQTHISNCVCTTREIFFSTILQNFYHFTV